MPKKTTDYNKSKFKLIQKLDIYNMKLPDPNEAHIIYPTEYLAQLSELFGRIIDSNCLHLFKDAYSRHFVLERVPLSAEALKQCKADVNLFISQVLVGNSSLMSAILHELIYRVNGSNDRDLQILFNAYRVIFYRATNRLEEYAQAMASLEASKDEFNDEHRYWYYRELGIIKRKALEYKNALSQFLKAEELIKCIEVNDKGLYIYIAYCLTYMHYTIDALEYLDESERLALKGFTSGSRIYNQLLYAVNYTNMGDAAKSLALLQGLMRDEMQVIKNTQHEMLLYSCLTNAYHELGEFEKAIDYVDRAIRYCKITEYHVGYKYYVYIKASIYNELGRINECYYEFDDALEFESKDEQLTDLLLNTLKHSLKLDSTESLTYVADYAIAKLLEYGLNKQAIEYHRKLCMYYSNAEKGVIDYKKALYHALEIDKIKTTLSKKGGYRS